MRKTPEQVKRLIEAYLNIDGVHKYPMVEVVSDVITAYDGDCPRFIIRYDAKKSDYDNSDGDDLINRIEKYTTLKHNRDYVLGYQWSWNS
jgi:hypothetical protein